MTWQLGKWFFVKLSYNGVVTLDLTQAVLDFPIPDRIAAKASFSLSMCVNSSKALFFLPTADHND